MSSVSSVSDDRPASDVADSLVDADVEYPIHIGADLLNRVGDLIARAAPAYRYAIVTDDNVAPLHATTVARALSASGSSRVETFVMPAGESHKTRATWAEISDAMMAWGAGRDTTVVAVGGGVVGDVAGFVAATYMRGVPVVQLPTTLLAMTDAAVGGKTGVDTPGGKNLVGAFHDPRLVVMAIETLATLPIDALRTGLAEVIKHGVIADAAYFARVLELLPHIGRADRMFATSTDHRTDPPRAWLDTLTEIVTGSVRIKASVVASDARESGARHTLNFGHTIAHAIEHLTAFAVPHGEAVAIGMVAEARIAERLGLAETDIAAPIVEALTTASLPTTIPATLDPADIVAATKSDKKSRSGDVRYALPTAIGAMDRNEGRYSRPVSDAVVIDVLRSAR